MDADTLKKLAKLLMTAKADINRANTEANKHTGNVASHIASNTSSAWIAVTDALHIVEKERRAQKQPTTQAPDGA
ncbi:hypothetical protein [Aquitalea sp. USM4]|uniref:hypothetical protein n=1 Tax=Aquitalea sp. USM4 TaxID=1590041 RepID=UPI001038A389|nr:hypothetical protein [Aquitalea sp. USM4]QBJ80555.1 hypothetical protein DKK66_20130 [Aquitalea sp. USM4]